MMAKSVVKFNCGCGFQCDNPMEAAIHADSKGHTLDVLGRILPEHKQEAKVARVMSSRTA